MRLMNNRYVRNLGITIATALLLSVLGFWQAVTAQPQPTPGAGNPPFANAVDQRNEMIRELREIRSLIKEQNALLKELVDHAKSSNKSKP